MATSLLQRALPLLPLLLLPIVATAAPKQPPERPDMIKMMDNNGDDSVSLQEFTAAAQKQAEEAFGHMDLDSNGQISRAELEELDKMMREQWQLRREQRERQP
ncbi:hypothetical protein D5085_03690 [Ectothiorhodospiraceae bacterium BW-2]|nr:hypothetical protein D5085_03690 [Ectothiorhodospiraceae bacterium BW-2]